MLLTEDSEIKYGVLSDQRLKYILFINPPSGAELQPEYKDRGTLNIEH